MVMRIVSDEEPGVALEDAIEAEEQELRAETDADGELSHAEPADGTVDERSDSAEAGGETADPAVIEALLLSTHHPLTAGRLAELLDLSSTKPVRGAIQQLNSDY